MVPMDFLGPKSQAAIAIAGIFLSLSFLNAHLIGLHVKEYFITICIPIMQYCHCNRHLLLEITPTLVLSPYILWSGPIFTLYRPYIFTVLALYRALYFDFQLAGRHVLYIGRRCSFAFPS